MYSQQNKARKKYCKIWSFTCDKRVCCLYCEKLETCKEKGWRAMASRDCYRRLLKRQKKCEYLCTFWQLVIEGEATEHIRRLEEIREDLKNMGIERMEVPYVKRVK